MSKPDGLVVVEHGHYMARAIADSISPDGVRLTTMEIVYPHPTHKDLLRHRAWSRSVMSFRAMPPEKLYVMLQDDNCYIPEPFLERIKGMGGGGPLSPEEQEVARELWLRAKNVAVATCQSLVDMGVAKEQANSLIQDFCWIREIVTATEWDNAFALRLALKPDGTPMARAEVYRIVDMMREVLNTNQPQQLDFGQWHLPLITDEELATLCKARDKQTRETYLGNLKRISARRCARVSFDKHTDTEDPLVSMQKADELLRNGHMSPFEHQARPAIVGNDGRPSFHGNFRGWFQQRYEIPNQDRYDRLVHDAAALVS